MGRSPDCDESVVLEIFWPFIETRKTHPQLQAWQECPFATTAEQIAAAEKALWCPLPESYKHFLLAWNGFNVPQRGQTADDISLLCCLDFLAEESPADSQYPEWADIVRGNSVRFRWEDQRTGQAIFRKVSLSQTGEALPGRGETPEGSAATEALQDLAERIVERLESSW